MVSFGDIREKVESFASEVLAGTRVLPNIVRLAGVVTDAAVVNVRLDRRLNIERKRFSRQESPLDFVSATFASVLGLPEDTVTENIARIRGTTGEGAHVFLLEWARRITAPRSVARRLVDRGVRTELRRAQEKGELQAALFEVPDEKRRKKLERRIR